GRLVSMVVPPRLFSSITWRPPTSPLFPYTTLFRSTDTLAAELFDLGALGVEVQEPGMLLMPGTPPLPAGAARCIAHFDALDEVGDRKSTRLNSSHLVISYAVFCLKKKNSTSTSVRH